MRGLLRLLVAAVIAVGAGVGLPVSVPLPSVAVVLWHGMGDNCCLPFSMGSVRATIEDKIKGAYVVSLMIGTNPADDSYNSYFLPVHKQLEMACEMVSSDPKLAAGFHAIGFSQGGLFVRALAQTCPGARILNLISIGGPQQGIFGLPQCLGDKGVCEEVRRLLDIGAYVPLVQDRLVQGRPSGMKTLQSDFIIAISFL